MRRERQGGHGGSDSGGSVRTSPSAPGKRTLIEARPIQRKAGPSTEAPTPSSGWSPAPTREHTEDAFDFDFSGRCAREMSGNSAPSGLIQRKTATAPELLPSAAPAVAAAAESAGAPLPASARDKFEQSLGADLGGVRVHTGAESANAARTVGARAYAIGNNIHFAAGEHDPSSVAGERLLAHEVAHTVQQQQGAVGRQAKLELSADGDGAEAEADVAADAMVRGAPARVGPAPSKLARVISPAMPTLVQRLTPSPPQRPAVTEADVSAVLGILAPLNDVDFTDTVIDLERQNLLSNLLEHVSAADQSAQAATLTRIRTTRGRGATSARLSFLLSNHIRPDDVHEVLVTLSALPTDQRAVQIEGLAQRGQIAVITASVTPADQTAFTSLLQEIQRVSRRVTDLEGGTFLPSAGQAHAVQGALTVVPPNTHFVDLVAGHTYRHDLEAALDAVRARMVPQVTAMFARNRLPMSRFEGIGQEAKRQVDVLFGRYAQGPAFTTAGANPNLRDHSQTPGDAADLVRYLCNNQRDMIPVHVAHGATPSNPSERAIIQQIINSYSAAHRAELELMDRGWPGINSGGIVEIQPFEAATPAGTRQQFWKSFQTMIHEYCHSITHPNYEQTARSLGGLKQSILIEGGTSLMTDHVWNLIFPTEVRANEQLRLNVEGSSMPFDATAIPPIRHYQQIDEARVIENSVGAENFRAAYLLGHVELLGLGPTYTPAAVARGNAFVVPAAGVATIAGVITATGGDLTDVLVLNNAQWTAATPVTPGQQILVPGIRVHIVRGGGETKAQIAHQNGVTEPLLDRANPGFHWGSLAAGQSIVIPVH